MREAVAYKLLRVYVMVMLSLFLQIEAKVDASEIKTEHTSTKPVYKPKQAAAPNNSLMANAFAKALEK